MFCVSGTFSVQNRNRAYSEESTIVDRLNMLTPKYKELIPTFSAKLNNAITSSNPAGNEETVVCRA